MIDIFLILARLVLVAAFGRMIDLAGYTLRDWQAWAMLAIFFGYGVIRGMHVRHQERSK